MDQSMLTTATEAYRAARKIGRRTVAEYNSRRQSGLLTVLEPLLPESHGELPLGLFEIPLSKIRGTYAAGRSSALSRGFMPLLPDESEFSAKWRVLYASALEKGITEPLRVFEYIGYYYVMEGHKRVSVAKVLSNYSLFAEVTRLLPPSETETPELAVFAEILNGDRKKIIRHMWFSLPGRLTELREFADDERLEGLFTDFRAAYHKQGFHHSIPGITTGDAFWQYVKIYGLPSETKASELQKNLALCRPQWELLAKPEAVKTISGPAEMGQRPLIYFSRGVMPSVAFAFRGGEQARCAAEAHDAGRYALQRAFPELPVSRICGLPAGSEAYEPLSRTLKKENILFVTDPDITGAALRIALERRNMLVLLCHGEPVGLPGTYCAKTEEAAFLMGVMAGSLSRKARIGWIWPPRHSGGRGKDLQAFAQGVSIIRPTARVHMSGGGENNLFKRWAERGIDIILKPYSAQGYRPAEKAFPGVYAQLCALSREGGITETLALAAWHWDEFYTNFLRGIIENGSHPEHLHFRLGLDSGVIDVHPTAAAENVRACLGVFHRALCDGTIEPINENMPVEVYEA